MVKNLFLGLIYNTSLLLVLGMLYSSITLRLKEKDKRICIVSGIIIGIVGIGIMSLPIPVVDGIFFDARSILISSTALFFGFGTVSIATIITGAYRFYLGGIGAPTGILVIVTSAVIGLIWRKYRFEKQIVENKTYPFLELYVFGIIVHTAMLLEMFTLGNISSYVLESIFLPVIIIYPIGSVVIGIILKYQMDRKKNLDNIKYNEKKYRTLVNEMKQSLILVEAIRNGKGNIVNLKALDCNSNFYRMINIKDEKYSIKGKELPDVFRDDDRKYIINIAEEVLDKESYNHEYNIEKNNRYFEINAYKVKKNQFAMLLNDITKKKELEKSIIESENRYRGMFNNNHAVMLLIESETGKILDANPSACSFYMYSLEELKNMKISEINALTDEAVLKEMDFAKSETRKHFNFVHRLSNGEARDVEVYSGPIEVNGEKILYSIVYDVTEKIRKQKEIEYLSFHDQLTELYNRRYFEEELNRLDVKRNMPFSIIMADVNGLKLVNDAFGHAIGDKLLVESASIMKNVCRDDEIISRVGGDEFVILLPKTDKRHAYKIIDRVRDIAMSTKLEDFNISISFGVSTKTEEDQIIETIYKEAEDDMYKNKLFESKKRKGNMIGTILNALHERSPMEKAHSERVSQFCGEMGEALGLGHDEINELKSTGLLHDIGKVALDDSILNKTEKMTDAEHFQLKRHPDIGYNILSSVNSLSITAEYVLAHHERWDGKGYPRGLVGEEIPYISRIISLADAYDKMTGFDRSKKSMTNEEAIEEIKSCSGTQFDPILSVIFIEKVLRKSKIDAV